MKLISLSILFCLTFSNLNSQTIPTGFVKTNVITGLQYPVHFDVSEDQRYFITQKGGNSSGSCANGKILVYSNSGALLSTFYDLTDSVQCDFERGLLGLALDPSFSTNNYVYAYYNHKYNSDERIRVVRFTESNNIGTNPLIILDINVAENIAGNHVGGIIEFKPSDATKLFITIGDLAKGQSLAADTSTNYADTKNTPYGKILRINTDGSIPTDNPFYDDGSVASGNDDRIWSYGHRNIFGLCFNPNNGSLYASENGYNKWDEVDFITPGKNYGWITCEGNYRYNSTSVLCSYPGLTNPIAEFGTPLPGITGCLFYSSSVIPSLTNHLLIADNDNGRMYNLTLGNAPDYDTVISNVQWADLTGTGEGGLTTLKQGPEGCIYAMNGGYTTNGKIYKICPSNLSLEENIVLSNELGQNYPNPSSGNSMIDFTIAKTADVTISIYDETGRKLSCAYSQTTSSGTHTVQLNYPMDLKNGNYFYKMEVKENNTLVFTSTKRMLIIK
jgi:glucose/arabinose dehydrogenase